MFHQHGVIAAHRFARTSLPSVVERSAKRWRLEPRVVAAVLAVEMLARGALWRYMELVTAYGLLALGCHARVDRMSLGIAQIQPRRMRGTDDIKQRVGVLRGESGSADECARLLAEICHQVRIDQLPPGRWSRDDWAQVALAYGGNRRYGDAMKAAFVALTQIALQTGADACSSEGGGSAARARPRSTGRS